LIAEPISQERSQELIHIEISEGISDPTQHDHDSLSKPSATPFEPVTTAMDATMGQTLKSLDELFMKTTTKPSLYYLPLTQQQIEEQRTTS
jgi:hypothetical protein